MSTFHVWADACDFGMIEAESEQAARDAASQIAGYNDEADMVARLESPSELVTVKVL